MPVYNAPIRDMQFLMHEMLNASSLNQYKKFEDVDVDFMDAVLEESGKFATEVLTPLNVVGDHEGCTRNPDGSVSVPTGFPEAFKTMAENGWTALGHDPEYGGQGHGSYKITGQKIFISAGEHDMSENIIHLVLARIEGAPDGVKGISLFIVPKYKLDADGNPGEKNGVTCGSIEEKMGIHGNCTCVMNYDDAEGYLIGQENKGLKVMFVMMNRARLDVGMQGLAQSEVAYQNAVAYATDRLQGRSLTGPKNENGPADPIIVHPDVRRMLMETKAFNEGARALIMWATLLEDLEGVHEDEKFREKADDYLGLLTPVIKGYMTDKAMQTTIDCQQIFGGHGFIEEWGMSQFVRDTRIALIYEGANGVQALDLVGRKLARNGGIRTMPARARLIICT